MFLSINSKSINDSKFHDIQLLRNEQSIELLVDGMFVNRTISPGSEATLESYLNTSMWGQGLTLEMTHCRMASKAVWLV